MREVAGIACLEAGEGPPLILLHGVGGDARSFAGQLGALPARAIAWNMPGYGGSRPIGAPYGFPDLADAVLRLMDGLGLDRAHLLGHSIGGMIALETAFAAPDRVSSLILVATTPAFGGRDDSFREAFLKARLGPLEGGEGMAGLASRFSADLAGNGASPELARAVEEQMAAIPEDAYRAAIGCLTTFDRRNDLHRVRARACLIAGERDATAPARTMQRMAERMPDAQLHVVGGAGHMAPMEAPEPCNAIVTDFLAARKEPR